MELKKFYATLIIFYFSDMALLLSVIWLSYQVTKNPIILGVMLFVSTLIPLMIKKFSKINLLSLSFSHLMIMRIVLYLMVFLLSLFEPNIYGFVALSCIFGILGVSIVSNYESYNNYLVVQECISAKDGARYMQTVIQIGAFAGAMIGGFLLNHLSFFWTMTSIVLVDVVFSLLCLYLIKFSFLDYNSNSNKNYLEESNKNQLSINKLGLDKTKFYILCLAIGLIGVHITSFNLTTPIIFQEIKQWSAQDFGLSSAFAGIGAFVAVFLKSNFRHSLWIAMVLIVVDIFFVILPNKILSLMMCFLIGLCMNSVRILIREQLSLLATNKEQAFFVGQNSAVFYTILQSLASLLIGILLASSGNIAIAQIFLPLMAVLMMLSIAYYVYILRVKKE